MEINADIQNLLADSLADDSFCKIILSSPFKKSAPFFKIQITSILDKQEYYQITCFYETKINHENIKSLEEVLARINLYLAEGYKNCNIILLSKTYTILMNKNGHSKILAKQNDQASQKNSTVHNKIKNHILKEGTPIPWLHKLGIMNQEGMVLSQKQKKFRQINRFLEMVADIAPNIPEHAEIVDVGCGKSYLTFALYYFLNEQLQKNVTIIGLDLKKDVVRHCQSLADEFDFRQLHFQAGDIADFIHPREKVDMVVTLHACDTATDYALFNAIKWEASVILSVPCCQHELYTQISNETLHPLLKHGIIKERFSALLTDSLRGLLLESVGYQCSIMEFIDTEHTPKNIMIRAIKIPKAQTKSSKEKAVHTYMKLQDEFHIMPTLYKLLKEGSIWT